MNRLRGFGRSRTGRLGLAAGVVVALMVGLTAPAYAHHANLSGETYCANNDHVITWSIQNSQTNLAMNIVSATASINGQSYAVTGYTNPVPNTGSRTTQATTVVPGPVQGTITLTVYASWPNGATWNGTTSVPLQGTCGCDCTSTSSSTTTTEPTTTTTYVTTTTKKQCGCTTTTTMPTTTTTEATTTTTEATTTTTEATTTTTEATTTTTEPTTTSTESLGSTTIVTTTTIGEQGSTVPTTAKSTTTQVPPVEGELPFTGSGTSIPLVFGIGSLIVGAALAFRKRGAWTR